MSDEQNDSTRNNNIAWVSLVNNVNSLQSSVSNIFNQRQNSLPETNSPSFHDDRMDYRIRSTLGGPSSSSASIVINIETEDGGTTPGNHRMRSPRNRGRSSNSMSSATSSHAENPLPPPTLRARGLVPELSNFAAQLFHANGGGGGGSSAGVSAARRLQHSPPVITPTSAPAGIGLRQLSDVVSYSATERSVSHSGGLGELGRGTTGTMAGYDDPTAAGVDLSGQHDGANGGGGGADSSTSGGVGADDSNNSIPQLRVLLESRDAICQYIVQNFTQFPNLHAFNFCVLGVVVVLILFSKFLINHYASCCALALGLLHYQGASRFMRAISGSSDVYVLVASVLARNALIWYVFDKRFILTVATFHDEVSTLANPGFFSTAYRIIAGEMFVMDVTLMCKLLIYKNPFISKIYKRRVYQWLEYTSAFYRFPIPSVQWCAYFQSVVWVVIYCIAKVLIGFPIAWCWIRTTLRLFRFSHLGTTPSADELRHAEQCTICYGEFTSPIKLSCNHIFCSECIRTWLDREVTCPICRATVSKEDNHCRNGNSLFPMHVF